MCQGKNLGNRSSKQVPVLKYLMRHRQEVLKGLERREYAMFMHGIGKQVVNGLLSA